MKRRLMMRISSLIIVLMSLGCGSATHHSLKIVDDTKVQVAAAKAANAQDFASQELKDAEQTLAWSEEALRDGKEIEAQRLGRRAYLQAKIAEAVAIANQMEAQAYNSEERLQLKFKDAETAHQDLKQAEKELKELQSTPEE